MVEICVYMIWSQQILERVGAITYRLALPPSLSSVHEVFHVSMLRKYTPDPAHVVDWGELSIDADGTFEEGPMLVCLFWIADIRFCDARL